ncbi:hypothetical protein MtrunA17_Chr4g0036151 [Medicago truncatula]|uniref:Uncharacterized protein n=1 Tax=Medicago truncatula TaxID=3880 RepID=A0A396I6Z1_MEDTR|nr:hypothetical protein MtrunA17_Chr4g0036151 [Medicago truncatula]
MVKAKENGNEEVWKTRLMDKVDCIGTELMDDTSASLTERLDGWMNLMNAY